MQLIQRRSPLSKTVFSLTDQLEVREESLFRSIDAQFALDRVAAKPLQVREFPVRWAIASVIFLALTAFALIDGWASRDLATIFGILLLGGCSAACVFNTWQLHRNLYVFRDRHTNQTLFAMLRASPSRDAVDSFTKRLAELSARPRPPAGAHKQEIAAFHARVVQQLLEEGVLLPEEHVAILGRLQRQQAPASIVKLFPDEP
jgi:hypothetical protein